MNTNNKVNMGETSTATSSSTTWRCPYTPKTEQGWECPRCGRINAPWKAQCDCSGNNYWYPTWGLNWDYREPWQKQITCDSDTFKVHPETTTWKAPSSACGSDSATVKANLDSITYTTGHNPIVGGSDYWDEVKKEWTNVPNAYGNFTTPADGPAST